MEHSTAERLAILAEAGQPDCYVCDEIAAELRRLSAIESEREALRAEVAKLRGWVNDAEQKAGALQRRLNAAEAEVERLRAAPAPVAQPLVTPHNVGAYCMSEDECNAAGIDFSAYERGVCDAAAAFGRNTPAPAPVAQPADTRSLAQGFEVTGPDADGLLWLVLHGLGTTGKAMFNLGAASRVAGQVALLWEQDRRAALAAAPAAVAQPLTDEQIDALMPPADGSAEANVRRVEVLPGLMGAEFDEVDAWSLPLVRQVVRAAIDATGQEGAA